MFFSLFWRGRRRFNATNKFLWINEDSNSCEDTRLITFLSFPQMKKILSKQKNINQNLKKPNTLLLIINLITFFTHISLYFFVYESLLAVHSFTSKLQAIFHPRTWIISAEYHLKITWDSIQISLHENCNVLTMF